MEGEGMKPVRWLVEGLLEGENAPITLTVNALDEKTAEAKAKRTYNFTTILSVRQKGRKLTETETLEMEIYRQFNEYKEGKKKFYG